MMYCALSRTEKASWSSMADLAVLFGYCILFSLLQITIALETINTSHALRDGGDTLVSSSGSFELGFFSPEGSTSRYLGLWYKKSPQTVLWVANREVPMSNKFGILNLTSQGTLILRNGTQNIVWSTNMSTTVQDPVAELMDSGNLVVREANDNSTGNFLWQSFDYPSDTLLPGMKLGSNFVAGLNRSLSCWRSTDDPSHGRFSMIIDIQGYPQLLVKRETRILYRLGPWNGLHFTGFTGLKPNPIYTYEYVFNQEEVYYKFELRNSSVFSRLTLFPLGHEQQLTWSDQTKDWVVFSQPEADQCDSYALCGANARCDINNFPVCSCLDGFLPSSARDWNLSNWSGGCVRSTPLNCSNNEGFLMYTGIKLPDTSSSWFDKSIDLKECKELCLKNCSCNAHANLDIREGGSGCLLWFDHLIDIRILTDSTQDLYVRMAASELGEKKRTFSKKLQAGIIVSSVILVMGMLISGTIYWKRRRNLRNNDNLEDPEDDMELPIFDLTIIAQATNNFSSINKLGEGGFGPVYKGSLIGGKEVAVKRLSKSSGQGLEEFKNEVILIAKLQHRNLVKLLGCCIHEDEKMLIYEYMPNKSLDFFIFDQSRRKLLDWRHRINVIGGIARGLLYLHQDSRLRIIHRDIKASNILLDNELNSKISDFGLARIFGGDETEANTNRVVGTYGYISPEYASDGHFSVKSDVYSFGVLVLEIVSGKKNRGFRHADQNLNLLGHAWMLWIKGAPLELIDECLTELCNPTEVLRCINVALLCVQQRPEDRPNMSTVVLMLSSEILLAKPKQPGFFMGQSPLEEDSSANNCKAYSENVVSMTSLEAR